MPGLKALKVGIAYEGGLDTSYAVCLISKMLTEKGFEISHLSTVKANTVITKLVPVYVVKFLGEDRDLMIFLTDSDDGVNTKQQIEEQIDKVSPLHKSISVIGIPDPNMEGWVISDEDAVKNVLGCDNTKPLPHPNIRAKDRLKTIHSESSSFMGTLDEAKIQIAEQASLRQMEAHSSSFRTFKADLDAFLNQQ